VGDALRISATDDPLKLGTVTGAYPVTMVCWAKRRADRNTYSAIFTIEDSDAHSTEYNELITDSDGTTLVVYDHVTGIVGTVGTLVADTWYKLAFVVTANAFKVYWGVEGTPGVTLAVSGTIANCSVVGLNGVGASNFLTTEWFDGCLSGLRVYNAELSWSEIELEFQSATAVRTADILGSWLPPAVTVPTVETAVIGDNLVNALGGTPGYTLEAGPTLDAGPPTSVFVPGPQFRNPNQQSSIISALKQSPSNSLMSKASTLLGAGPVGAFTAVAKSGFFDAAPAPPATTGFNTAIFCGV
jgi:hypothetical protein